jgi:hypothetical protein
VSTRREREQLGANLNSVDSFRTELSRLRFKPKRSVLRSACSIARGAMVRTTTNDTPPRPRDVA